MKRDQTMKNIILITYILLAGIIFSMPAQSATLSNAQQLKDCSFEKTGTWWKQLYNTLPADVANNPVTEEPEFCEFYQFAQDWFLYLISPSATPGLANWEIQSQFPLLETTGTNSCDSNYPAHALNVRTAKAADDSNEFVIPERINQAGGEHAIYDQEGNVVFYEIRFSRNLCDYDNILKKLNFPGKTVELKLAWRVLNDDDIVSDYYQTNATINGKNYQLGLIGWHIVVAADNHPEFVWITLDHKNNAVVCDEISATEHAYDFTSKACAQNKSKCNHLNKTLKSTAVTLPKGQKPYDICQEFPYGTVAGKSIDTNDGLNIALIKKLNDQLQNTIFTQSGLPESLDIWKNYQFTGALWVSDIAESSSVSSNQRGSLELANTVMETSFQGTSGVSGSSVNCFGCHGYNGTSTLKSNTLGGLSHIFDDVIEGQQCMDVTASHVINSQSQAGAECPSTCAGTSSNLKWNGQWTNQNAKTGTQLPMTVCGCCPK